MKIAQTSEIVTVGGKAVEVTHNGSRVQCPGCGEYFRGVRGLRAHMSGRFVTAACRPMIEVSS